MAITIVNKKTGERKTVQETDLPSYGISSPTQPQTPPQPKEIASPGMQDIQAGINPALVGFAKLQELLGKSSALPTTLSTIGSILTPGMGVGAAGGEFIGNTLKQMNLKGGGGPEGLKELIPTGSELAESGGKAALSGGLDVGLGLAGKGLKALGGKVAPMLKGILPEQLVSSLKTAKTTISGSIDKLLKSSKETISVTPIVEKLNGLKATYTERGNEAAVESVDNVIKFLTKQGMDLTPAKANALKIGFGEDIFGQAGKEVSKRGGAGIAEKSAKQIAGGELETAIKTTVPGIDKLFDQYGQVAQTSRLMNRPFQGWWKGSVAGMLLQPFGLASVPVTAGITAASMPYSRLLLQRLLGQTGNVLSSPVTGAAGQVGLNQLLNMGQE